MTAEQFPQVLDGSSPPKAYTEDTHNEWVRVEDSVLAWAKKVGRGTHPDS